MRTKKTTFFSLSNLENIAPHKKYFAPKSFFFFFIFFHYQRVYVFKTILADEKMDGLKFLMRTDVGINKVVDRL